MTEHKKFEEIKYRAIFIHVDLPGQEDNAKDFPRYVLLQSRLRMFFTSLQSVVLFLKFPKLNFFPNFSLL